MYCAAATAREKIEENPSIQRRLLFERLKDSVLRALISARDVVHVLPGAISLALGLDALRALLVLNLQTNGAKLLAGV